MTPKQKLELEMSRGRQRMRELLSSEELDDSAKDEIEQLTRRHESMEIEYRAACLAYPESETMNSSAPKELGGLLDTANMGSIFEAAVEHRQTDGAERELQQHFGLAANQVPLALLEQRAVTPAPSNVGTNQSEIIPAVFPQSAAAFLSIDIPAVAVGEIVYPVLSTSASVGTPAENAAQAETTGAFTADVLSPSRLQASFFYSREDRARFAGMDSALRMNLSDALSDSLDKQIISGTNGLLTGTVLANHNVDAVTTYALYRDHLAYGRVDGVYAGTVGDIRVLVGAATYAHAAKAFRSDNAGDRAALEDLMSVTGGVRVSAHVPAVASTKQTTIVRLGTRRDMVAPVWEGVTIIPDEISLAANGQIKITAVMLYATKVVRAAGFFKQTVQIA